MEDAAAFERDWLAQQHEQRQRQQPERRRESAADTRGRRTHNEEVQGWRARTSRSPTRRRRSRSRHVPCVVGVLGCAEAWARREGRGGRFRSRSSSREAGELRRARSRTPERHRWGDTRDEERHNHLRHASPPRPPRNDWLCPRDGTLNFARRDACFSCGAPRTADAVPALQDALGLTPCVLVHGIEPQVSEAALQFAISALGGTAVREVRLIRSRDAAAEWKGFAFVDLFTHEAAAKVVALLDGAQLEGQARRVRVSLAKDRGPLGAPVAAAHVPGLAHQPCELFGADADQAADAALSAWQPREFGDDAAEEPSPEAEPEAKPEPWMLPDTQTSSWLNYDAAAAQHSAVAQSSNAAAEMEPSVGARPGAVTGSAAKLSAEALATRDAELRRAAAAAAAAAAAPAPAAPSQLLQGGKVYGGKIRTPKEPTANQ